MKPTTTASRRVLSIDPGSKFIGAALLEKEILWFHDVLVIRGNTSRAALLSEIRDRVDRLITDFRPDLIAIEKTFVGRNRRAAILNVIFDDLVALAKERKLPVVSASPMTVRKWITGDGWATKEDVAKAIVSRWFRELRPYLGMKRASQGAFHFNRFDAIAVGLWATSNRI